MSGTVEFIILLGVINVVFFLPFYLLNVRNQPNPFHFLVDTTTTTKQKLKMPFIKFSSDPFRINMDYAYRRSEVYRNRVNYSQILEISLILRIVSDSMPDDMRHVFAQCLSDEPRAQWVSPWRRISKSC